VFHSLTTRIAIHTPPFVLHACPRHTARRPNRYDEWAKHCKAGDDVNATCIWLPWAYWGTFVRDEFVDPYALSFPLCSAELNAGKHQGGHHAQRFRLLDLLLQVGITTPEPLPRACDLPLCGLAGCGLTCGAVLPMV